MKKIDRVKYSGYIISSIGKQFLKIKASPVICKDE